MYNQAISRPRRAPTSFLEKSTDIGPLQPLADTSLTPMLSPTEKENADYLIEKHGLTEDEAIQLIKNDESWSAFLKDLKKRTDLKNIEIIEKAQKKIEEKIEAGFMEAAQKGSLILAILQDKTFGVPSTQGGPMFNVAGKQVSIKVGFGFKPYQKK